MKLIIVTLCLAVTCAIACGSQAQHDLRECIGMTSDGRFATAFVTSDEDADSSPQYALSCVHWAPVVGSVLTFGNGQTGTVASVHPVRGGLFGGNQYDISVIQLSAPVQVKPALVWWYRPLDLVNFQITAQGFGPSGWFQATRGRIITYTPEIYTGLYYDAPAGLIGPGYSGGPVFYQGRLIAITCLDLRSPNGITKGAISNTIFQVFAQYHQNFVGIPSPPVVTQMRICQRDGLVEVTVRNPPGVVPAIECSTALGDSTWTPVQQESSYKGRVACPDIWESHSFCWDKSSGRQAFFRALTP